MNKKISLGLAIALIVLSVTASFAITMSVSQRMYNKLITDLPKRAQMYDAVEEVDKIVRSKYYGDIDEAMLDSNLENGYINGLGDKYSRYMNADAYKLYSSKLEGRSAGIGVEVETDPVSGYLLITEVYPNSPGADRRPSKGRQDSCHRRRHGNCRKQRRDGGQAQRHKADLRQPHLQAR